MPNHFTLEYWQDDEWFVGKLKEVPGVFSQGETLNELIENIQDAYKMMIDENDLINLSVDKKQEIGVEI